MQLLDLDSTKHLSNPSVHFRIAETLNSPQNSEITAK